MGLSLYNIKKWWRMITHRSILHVNQGEGRCYSFESLQGYYNDLTEKVLKDKENYSSLEVIKAEDGTGKEKYDFSIAIFQYALASYDLMLLHQDEELMKNKFLVHLKWAFDNQEENGSWRTFQRLNSDHPYSSMAQSEGASVLLRGYVLTKDNKYLVAAKKALDFMLLPLADGGTTKYDNSGLIEYEFTYLPYVFNGWIFSIFGLMDYVVLTKDEFYLEKLNMSLSMFEQELPKMDCKYWSLYSNDNKIASLFYHKLHIAQLKVLYKYTGNDIYRIYYEKFEKYQSKRLNRFRAFLKKAFQKVFK